MAAISYYVVELFSYSGKAVKALGVNANMDVVLGILVPFMVCGWAGARCTARCTGDHPRLESLKQEKKS